MALRAPPQPRREVFVYLGDWLVNGSGRLAFKAHSTPLVGLASVPFACWPGYSGDTTKPDVAASAIEEWVRDTARELKGFVASTEAPLLQAENKAVCNRPRAREESLLPRLQTALDRAGGL